jgi:hypothetical protein
MPLCSLVKFTLPCVFRHSKLYSYLKGFKERFCMPDFLEHQFNNYYIKLRPNDTFRKELAVFGLPDMLNYFNSSEICLDLRFAVLNNKENRNIIVLYLLLQYLNDISFSSLRGARFVTYVSEQAPQSRWIWRGMRLPHPDLSGLTTTREVLSNVINI